MSTTKPTSPDVSPDAPSPLPTPANFPVAWDSPEDERLFWIRDQMHCPDPIAPLDEAFIRLVYQGISTVAERYEFPFRTRLRRINTYVYWAPVPIDGTPAEMTAMAERSEAKLEAVFGRLGEIWRAEVLPEVKRHLAHWEGFDLGGAPLPAVRAHLDDTVARHRRLWELHFRVVLPKHIVISMFDDLYRDLFGNETAFDAYRLLQGFDNKTLESDRALWRLSRAAAASPAVRRTLEERAAADVAPVLAQSPEGVAFLEALRAYLDEYGRRCPKPIHYSEPSWIEEPSPAIKNLKDYVTRSDGEPPVELAALAAERDRLVARARERLSGYPRPVVERFEHLLTAAQEAAVVSEDHNYWIDFRAAYEVRRVLIECGRRLAAAGALGQPNDVFCLTLDELRETLASPSGGDRRRLVAGRQAEMAYFRGVRPPAALGTPPAGAPPDNPLDRAWGKFLGGPPPAPVDPDVLLGHAGSPGRVRGPARVIRSLADAARVRPGDVLVTETTSAPWTPLFGTVAAIVTDAGGVLSHCAVVAREYRIPAVVGVGNATAMIRDGQTLEVDGGEGIVRLVSDAVTARQVGTNPARPARRDRVSWFTSARPMEDARPRHVGGHISVRSVDERGPDFARRRAVRR